MNLSLKQQIMLRRIRKAKAVQGGSSKNNAASPTAARDTRKLNTSVA